MGLSPFESLIFSPPILSLVAFYLAIDPFVGPPSNLVPLLLTSRTVHDHLSFRHNSSLYAHIFRYKFDTGAIDRRLTQRWTSAPCLAEELRSRFTALNYVRRGKSDLQEDKDPLWRVYLMALENDGRNARQIAKWASLPRWVLAGLARRCLRLPAMNTAGDRPLDLEGTSLFLWLLWMMNSEG